jgi:hypothetical protein
MSSLSDEFGTNMEKMVGNKCTCVEVPEGRVYL